MQKPSDPHWSDIFEAGMEDALEGKPATIQEGHYWHGYTYGLWRSWRRRGRRHPRRRRVETDQEHEEANIFAAYLLMPEGMFEADVCKLQGDPKMVSKLCLKYGVDQNVLAYRIKLMGEDKIHEKS